YIVHGNHDSLDGWSANLNWPQNVHIFGGKAVEKTTFEKGGDKIAEIYGISFPKQEIRTNLALEFPEISKSKTSIFTIGLLHCNVGSNTGHEPYAPCALQDLISRNFDYWALGHIHNKTISNKQTPLVIYPGNPQGLNPGEDGKKGCFLINVDKNGDAITDFIETDYVRWFTEKLSIENLNTIDELISGIEKCIENIRKKMKGRLSICRIVLTDRGILHQIITRRGTLEDILQNLRENELTESQSVWIESIIDNTNPKIEKESLLKRKDFIGDLVRFFGEITHNNNVSEQLKKTIEPLFSSSSGRKLLESISDEYLLDLIEKAEKRCLDKLIEPDSNEN
ncbi:phosphoesterase, partial [Patescibacteria group bacterium]|nr:phosphoesterase [Patescibacteria group bacterium]